MLKRVLILLLVFASLFSFGASAAQAPESPCVRDGAGILSQNTEDYFTKINEAVKSVAQGEILVYTVETTGEKSAQDHAQRIFDEIVFAGSEKANSVLILMVENSTDYGLVLGENTEKFINSKDISDIGMLLRSGGSNGYFDSSFDSSYDAAARLAVAGLIDHYELFYGEKITEKAQRPEGMSTAAKVILIVLGVLVLVVIAGLLFSTKIESLEKMFPGGKKWRLRRIPGTFVYYAEDATAYNDSNLWTFRRKKR